MDIAIVTAVLTSCDYLLLLATAAAIVILQAATAVLVVLGVAVGRVAARFV